MNLNEVPSNSLKGNEYVTVEAKGDIAKILNEMKDKGYAYEGNSNNLLIFKKTSKGLING